MEVAKIVICEEVSDPVQKADYFVSPRILDIALQPSSPIPPSGKWVPNELFNGSYRWFPDWSNPNLGVTQANPKLSGVRRDYYIGFIGVPWP